jgi:ribosome-associated protein
MENKEIIFKEMGSIIDELTKNSAEQSQVERAEVMALSWLLIHLQGYNLSLIDLREEETSFTNYLVVANGTNPRHAKSIAEDVVQAMKHFNVKCFSQEGQDSADWILLDFSHFIVHIFLESSRNLYDIEGLWSMGKKISVPDEYYHSHVQKAAMKEQEAKEGTDDPESYF